MSEKKFTLSMEVIHSCFTKMIYPVYVYLLKGTVFTEETESLPGGQGPRLLPKGISCSPNPLLV